MRVRLLIWGLLVPAAAVSAEFVHVDVRNVPVDRVVANLERQILERPKDVELLINLARVHAMAYATKAGTLPTHPPDRVWLGFGVPPYRQFEVRSAANGNAQTRSRQHLQKSIARYREALAIEPANPVAKMGLGWAHVQAGDAGAAITTLREVIRDAWLEDQKPGAATRTPMHGQPYLTEEAARYLIPLLDPERDRQEIDLLNQRLRTLSETPRWITPIAIPLADRLSATDIVDDRAAVTFDLDGSGIAKRWTWIRSNAAWLVFDRERTGRVTSGLQLFGNVTFRLFWRHGYDALGALDDNGDGAIRGAELDGLALWHDRNGNGSSERGEVRPVRDWRIIAISCAYEYDAAHPDEIAMSQRGVTFRSGETRPTFDVVLRQWRIAPSGVARIKANVSTLARLE